MREQTRTVLAIGIVALCSLGVLGGAYLVIGQIAAGRLADSGLSPYHDFLPEAVSFTPVEFAGRVVHEARDASGAAFGLVFTEVAEGFCGPIEILVALNPHSEQIIKIKILTQTETPGLGDRITAPDFTDRFSGKRAADLVRIDAISGATISSQAVTAAVDKSVRQVLALYRGETP
ncbi:MAG: FMN-binding protein [Firmicutes bacterium]|nr:FMN-binding protein [Bacillota bacterium]